MLHFPATAAYMSRQTMRRPRAHRGPCLRSKHARSCSSTGSVSSPAPRLPPPPPPRRRKGADMPGQEAPPSPRSLLWLPGSRRSRPGSGVTGWEMTPTGAPDVYGTDFPPHRQRKRVAGERLPPGRGPRHVTARGVTWPRAAAAMGTALDIKIKRANKVYRCGVSAAPTDARPRPRRETGAVAAGARPGLMPSPRGRSHSPVPCPGSWLSAGRCRQRGGSGALPRKVEQFASFPCLPLRWRSLPRWWGCGCGKLRLRPCSDLSLFAAAPLPVAAP